MRKALVVGMGASGLLASTLLALKGWKVTAVGRGTPASAMSTGCVRGVLHPECMKEVQTLFQAAGMPMVGRNETRTGATNIGTRFECTLSPQRSTWDQGDGPKSLTVLGSDGHPSMRPMLAASVLNTWGPKTKGRKLELKVPADISLSTIFRSEGMIDYLVNEVQQCSGEAVLLPSLFSLSDYGRWQELERRSGRKVLEAVTPLGEPGLRFVQALEAGAARSGVELWPGRKMTSLKVKGNALLEAEVQGELESRWVEADAVLMASGGPLGDGLLLREGMTDPFGTFRLANAGPAIENGYAHRQGRLLAKDGSVMENVFGAGDCLASPKRKYGQGLAEALNDAWDIVQAMEAV
ncbi:MAG: hypothetical protein NT131_02230 [Methanomassiliicoccales archaeon]|nr:hypothetical protein [Methanomassiliicoccales archaeon]